MSLARRMSVTWAIFTFSRELGVVVAEALGAGRFEV